MTATKAKAPKLYKIVGLKGSPIHGGSGLWSMPTKAKPGKWMPKIENISVCQRGYHLISARAIVDWLPHDPLTALLCEAEGRGARDNEGEKIAFAQARILKVIGLLDEVSMHLAAADIAERVLPIFSKMRPDDDRPAKAIQAARDFALGKMRNAARSAARAAQNAAWNAAGAAAWDAAWAAGNGASNAAGAAAGDAAGAAAAAARGAAGGAAPAAAGAAARAAAGDAN